MGLNPGGTAGPNAGFFIKVIGDLLLRGIGCFLTNCEKERPVFPPISYQALIQITNFGIYFTDESP